MHWQTKPVTKYDLAKSSLMASTTVARSSSAAPDPSVANLRSFSTSDGDGERRKEAAIPNSSEPYQAILRRAFRGSGSPLVDEFSTLHRTLLNFRL